MSRFVPQRLRRFAPVVAYLLLAAALIYVITLEHHNSQVSRTRIASETRIVLVAGCERQNLLRSTLRSLVEAGIPQTKKFVKEGTLTPAQGRRSITQTKAAEKKLANTNCRKAISPTALNP